MINNFFPYTDLAMSSLFMAMVLVCLVQVVKWLRQVLAVKIVQQYLCTYFRSARLGCSNALCPVVFSSVTGPVAVVLWCVAASFPVQMQFPP